MVLFTYKLSKKAGNWMDVSTLYSTIKENAWVSLAIFIAPFVVKLLEMYTASKLEKHIFKPKQKIYTQALNLLLHSTAATVVVYLFFLVMGVTIYDLSFLAIVFFVYLIFFLIVLPFMEARYRPVHYIDDDIHGKLYLQNVSSEGNLILHSKPNPNKEDGFYVIKEGTDALLNTKIHSIRKDQSRITKTVLMWIVKRFKKKQNISP